jgi:translation elongation factor EF-1beta
VKVNREKQHLRNKNNQKPTGDCLSNIVKTDTLISGKLISFGLYEILPYKTDPDKKIVKTDALIVELRVHQGVQKVQVSDSG